MWHGPQFCPSSPSLPPSLPPFLFFSLSSVQHPGLKILRSDSSSSISSRIGWTCLSLSLYAPTGLSLLPSTVSSSPLLLRLVWPCRCASPTVITWLTSCFLTTPPPHPPATHTSWTDPWRQGSFNSTLDVWLCWRIPLIALTLWPCVCEGDDARV